jgi:tRNA A37 methylthiotransferase MiaB
VTLDLWTEECEEEEDYEFGIVERMRNMKKENSGCSSACHSCVVKKLRGRTRKKRTSTAREIRQCHKESRQNGG